MFGKKQRIIEEQQKTIDALKAEVERLTQENQAFTARVADIERRESGIGRAISEATTTADQLIESAQRKAGAMLEQTQADCEAERRDAERLVDDAYRNARDIVKEAETAGQQKMDAVDAQIHQYATLLNAYDSLVQEQMQQAQDSAKRFSELARALHDTVPKILAPDGTLLIPESYEEPVPMEEPEKESPDEGESTPLYKEDFSEYAAGPFPFEGQREDGEERLWTVDEIAKPTGETQNTHVDSIIEDILRASRDQNRE